MRPEYDYVSKEALLEDIREDIRVAQRSLAREAYEAWKEDEWLGAKEEEEEKEPGSNCSLGAAGQKDSVGMSMMGA